MIIVFDIGNSYVKWLLCDSDGNTVSRDLCAHGQLADSLQQLAETHFHMAVYCNVADNGLIATIKGLLTAEQWLAVESQKNLLGVTNGYLKPELLGVDRWLACVEAYNLFSGRFAVMVVDVGTAVTVDVVSQCGKHQGGFIVPSMHLMQASLLAGTDKVTVDGSDCQSGYGITTNCAVKQGIQRLFLAWLRHEMAEFKHCYPTGKIIFTGGGCNMSFIEDEIKQADCCFEQDLLLRALVRVAGEQGK